MTPVLPVPAPGNLRLDERLRQAAADEEARQLTRRCPPIEERVGLRYRLDGREVESFCSNDYLGLAAEPGLPTSEALASGAAGSRLVCGDLPEHRALEQRFAEAVGFEDAVLFPSGFQANVGVPGCLLEEGEPAYSDALNHASLIDGLRLSRARREIVPHLQRPPADGWWFCESVFSMDGDGPSTIALEGHLAAGGCLYLDEAHALGLFADGHGRSGQMSRKPTVMLAPLGKAMGCAGAFVCGSATVCGWIRSHARGFVFSTAVSPVLLPRIHDAMDLVFGEDGERRREALWANVDRLTAALADFVALPSGGRSPILPLTVGSNARALELSARLLARGWHVQAIRPPTVPEGGARLRITVSAAHEPARIDAFARDLLTELKTP
ncbi:MAG: aminotransferase class I/II-fold pyridoxal phosphate-dependent enzyme [Myxococcales bacterium]|nr:aminotransferase class I/II-fold pyridoxal phosphate-dependent enzyme [Myxococcales bacterium]